MISVVSKLYCSSSEVVLVVRKRPKVVSGGGFVVTNCTQKVIFRVDGCGIVGRRGEVILRDGDGAQLLLIRQKGGIIQALSIHKQWKGYAFDYEGLTEKLVFSVREPSTCFSRSNAIKVSLEQSRGQVFQISGSFPDRNCTLLDHLGNQIAKIGAEEEAGQVMQTKDVYHVKIKSGVDQAFVFGVIAVLDYIHNESTRC